MKEERLFQKNGYFIWRKERFYIRRRRYRITQQPIVDLKEKNVVLPCLTDVKNVENSRRWKKMREWQIKNVSNGKNKLLPVKSVSVATEPESTVRNFCNFFTLSSSLGNFAYVSRHRIYFT